MVKEAYLVVKDGYKDAPSENLKYPHHKIKNGELVVDEAGLIAAFQRAAQQGIVSGAVKSHLLKHYRELGLSTENFEEKEGQAEMAKIKEEELDKEKKMSTEEASEVKVETENIDKDSEAEDAKKDVEMENPKEEVEMGCGSEKMEDDKKEDEVEEPEDEDKEDEDKEDEDDKKEVDYEAKISEYESKIAEMEEEKKVYMSELEELRKYKADREESDKNFAIEEVFSQISEVMPQDKIDELREEAKEVGFEAIDGFKNKIKAMAFEYTSVNKEAVQNRMAIVNIESEKTRKSFDWYN